MRILPVMRARVVVESLMGRFGANSSGVAAVEFGLLVPLLFIMFIGTVQIGQAVGLDRRVSMATSSTADLIAREKTLGNDPVGTLDGIMKIVDHLLTPYDVAPLQISVISVRADSVNPAKITVDWSYSYHNATVPSDCSSYTMPAGLLGAGSTAIIVEGRYDYEPILGNHVISNMTLQDKATLSPRYSCVIFAGKNDNCTPKCQ